MDQSRARVTAGVKPAPFLHFFSQQLCDTSPWIHMYHSVGEGCTPEMKIAVDLGNRYVKAVSESGERILFRSVVAEGQRRRVFSLSASPSKSEDVLQVRFYDGDQTRDMYVGKMAERFGTLPEYVFGRERFASESAELLVWTALGCLVRDEEPVDLVVDFPYSQYPIVQAEFAARLRGVQKDLEIVDGQRKRLVIRSVTTYPQSLVAAYSLASEYQEFADEDGYLAVVDIGGDTTDVVVLEVSGTEILVHEELSSTLSHGARNLTSVIRRVFEAETGEMLDPDLADRVLEQGSIYYGDRVWSCEEEVTRAKKSLARSIHSQLADLWGSKRNRVRAVFWIGGGAQILQEALAGFHPHEVFVKDAQWVNAKGCLQAVMGSHTVETQASARQSGQSISQDVGKREMTADDIRVTPEPQGQAPSERSQDLSQRPVLATDKPEAVSAPEPRSESRVEHLQPATDSTSRLHDEPVGVGAGSAQPKRDIPARFREGRSAW
ncbi:ParM/StbA family protein [Alicyclobacillus macrosporangiidus]|uniref:ParM/StbA family protein n=1 Tax=Alicyclobacillus macrosporangiidus TaxID=392015 RepID=UPI0009F80E5E